MYKNIQKKLDNGQTIILDGGTGTDIQRRGVPMSGETWSAEVNLTHPDIVRAVDEYFVPGCPFTILHKSYFVVAQREVKKERPRRKRAKER